MRPVLDRRADESERLIEHDFDDAPLVPACKVEMPERLVELWSELFEVPHVAYRRTLRDRARRVSVTE